MGLYSVMLILVIFVATTANGVNGTGCGCGYDYATKYSNGPTPGARNLANYIKNNYGGRTEIFNPRKIGGSSRISLHGEGRAVDWYPGSEAVFNAMIGMACSSGIQEVIYNRRIWTSGKGIRPYSGTNPHTTHLHV